MITTITVEPYSDGAIISFPLLTTPQDQFQTLLECLKRNKSAGKIEIADCCLDKENTMTIKVTGISDCVQEFRQLVEFELLTATFFPPKECSLREKILDEFHKLVGESS